jgi:DNA-binding LytR/AlgR family response regulator
MQIDYSKQIGKKFRIFKKDEILVEMTDILYLQCRENYTTIYMKDGDSYKVRKTLKAFDYEFKGYALLRIHNNTIANAKYMEFVEQTEKGKIVHLEKNKKWGKILLNMSKRKAALLRKEYPLSGL